ncbi:hypothetical protein TNCV_1907591 [Trichonephila clavipes]|nr:hypothetical protein TNCV_1907591 [Trichonephila clavipes]
MIALFTSSFLSQDGEGWKRKARHFTDKKCSIGPWRVFHSEFNDGEESVYRDNKTIWKGASFSFLVRSGRALKKSRMGKFVVTLLGRHCCAIRPGFNTRMFVNVWCQCGMRTLRRRKSSREVAGMEERWESSCSLPMMFFQNWGGTEPKRAVIHNMILKATANERHKLDPCHD